MDDRQNDCITLRPFQDADVPLFTQWLHKPYVLKWYLEPTGWLAEINGRNDEFSWIHHFIVMGGDKPIGFCQYYDCYDAMDMEAWYEVSRRGDTFSIDYMIGEEAYLGKGYGKAIVKLLTETVAQIDGARQIIAQPDAENHASNHVLLANGYVYDAEKQYYCKRLPG